MITEARLKVGLGLLVRAVGFHTHRSNGAMSFEPVGINTSSLVPPVEDVVSRSF